MRLRRFFVYKYAIKILNDKHSILVQYELYRLGYQWNSGSDILPRAVGEYIKAYEHGIALDFGNDTTGAEILQLKDLKKL